MCLATYNSRAQILWQSQWLAIDESEREQEMNKDFLYRHSPAKEEFQEYPRMLKRADVNVRDVEDENTGPLTFWPWDQSAAIPKNLKMNPIMQDSISIQRPAIIGRMYCRHYCLCNSTFLKTFFHFWRTLKILKRWKCSKQHHQFLSAVVLQEWERMKSGIISGHTWCSLWIWIVFSLPACNMCCVIFRKTECMWCTHRLPLHIPFYINSTLSYQMNAAL